MSENPFSIWPEGSPLRDMERTDRGRQERLDRERRAFLDRMRESDSTDEVDVIELSRTTASDDEPSMLGRVVKWSLVAFVLLLFII